MEFRSFQSLTYFVKIFTAGCEREKPLFFVSLMVYAFVSRSSLEQQGHEGQDGRNRGIPQAEMGFCV